MSHLPVLVLERWLQPWIERRTPAQRELTLSQRQIFIMPNRYGMGFLGLVLLIFILGTNYQNNLMLAFAFWLAALFVFSILLTFHNLSGVVLRAGRGGSNYAEQPIVHTWSLSGRRAHYGLRVLHPSHDQFIEKVGAERPVEVNTITQHARRGRFSAPRMRVETRFPFGWVTAWTWFQPEQYALVWPVPRDHGVVPIADTALPNLSNATSLHRSDDLDNVRAYEPGDVPRRVLWRHYARRGVMMVKVPSTVGVDAQTFSLAQVAHLPLEYGLEQLSFWLTEACEQGRSWALHLDGEVIPLSTGVEHLHRCLSRLATVGGQDAL